MRVLFCGLHNQNRRQVSWRPGREAARMFRNAVDRAGAGTRNPAMDATTVQRNAYREQVDSIKIGYLGRCRDLCPVNSSGAISDSALSLTNDIQLRTAPIFLYRLVGSY